MSNFDAEKAPDPALFFILKLLNRLDLKNHKNRKIRAVLEKLCFFE